MSTPPDLLIAAHGTGSAAGLATLHALTDLVRRALPGTDVRLCFLDVIEPSLATALVDMHRPTVIVPALLSTGYHVVDDIPAVIADRTEIRVTRHLGPHPLITAALVDRLAEAGALDAERVVLLASGSTNPAAADDLRGAAGDLAAAIGRPVSVATMGEDLPPGPDVAVSSYLLAEGFFAGRVRAKAAAAGIERVAAPIGAHPDIARLIVERYRSAAA